MTIRGRILLSVLALTMLVIGGESASAVPAEYRPDGMVRSATGPSFRGDGVYNNTGSGQTSERRIQAQGVGDFFVQIQNDGSSPDTIRVWGSSHTARFSVKYFLGSNEVTGAVKAGSLRLEALAPGQARTLRVRIATRRSVPPGAALTVRVESHSTSRGGVDVARARVERPLYSGEQITVRDQINASRASAGLSGLAMNRTLAAKAQDWAQHLASIQRLEHSNLTSGVPSNWQALAENVGYHTSLGGVHGLFMGSPGHRANILGHYNSVGTGVAHTGQWVYVVHVFMRS